MSECDTVRIQVETSEGNPTGIVAINKSEYDANPDEFLLEGMAIEEKYAEIDARKQSSEPSLTSEQVGASVAGASDEGDGEEGDGEEASDAPRPKTGKKKKK